MLAIFFDFVEHIIEVFMDDLSVYEVTFDLCLDNLTKVLHRYEEVNLVLNRKKCHFMVQEVIVLGHMVSQRGIEVDKANIEVIECLPPPTAKPLTLLIAKNTPFIFSNEYLEAFYRIKEALITAPIIKLPNSSLPSKLCVMLVIIRLGRIWGNKRQEALCYLLC